MTPSKINLFLIAKLPSAFLCGVRVKYLDSKKCSVAVKHRWINQNPFKSLFWAVQGMAAELSTGALVMQKVQASGKRISMLVTANSATYSKKATGKILFECLDGKAIDAVIKMALKTGEGQTVSLQSRGVNSEGIEVSKFVFEWSLKVK